MLLNQLGGMNSVSEQSTLKQSAAPLGKGGGLSAGQEWAKCWESPKSFEIEVICELLEDADGICSRGCVVLLVQPHIPWKIKVHGGPH